MFKLHHQTSNIYPTVKTPGKVPPHPKVTQAVCTGVNTAGNRASSYNITHHMDERTSLVLNENLNYFENFV